MNLESNSILYAGLICVIKRGTAERLEEDDAGILIRDTVSDAVMLVTDCYETGVEWLIKHERMKYHLMTVFRKDIAEFVENR